MFEMLIGLPPPLGGAGTSKQLPPAPVMPLRMDTAMTSLNGKIYLHGGATTGSVYLDEFSAYDIASNTWATLSKVGLAAIRHNLLAVNDKIYVILGLWKPVASGATYNPQIWEYTPATDTWARKTDIPTRIQRTQAQCVVYNNKIYCVGGAANTGGLYSDTYVYDPVPDTWTRLTNCPVEKSTGGISEINGKLYVFGGQTKPGVKERSMYVYDIAANTWALETATGFTARSSFYYGTWNGKVYVASGLSPSSSLLKDVWNYDPVSKVFAQTTDVPTGHDLGGSTVYDGKLHCYGGRNAPSYTPSSDFYAYQL